MSIQSLDSLFPKTSDAIISECGKYRYSLTRIWDTSKPKVMFIMLNPSIADSSNDDPTIRRCIGFAKDWGFGGLFVCNLFAYRATNPKELLKVDNPIGDQNNYHLNQNAAEVDLIICAWGNYPIIKQIIKDDFPLKIEAIHFEKLHVIELSNQGIPKHPLYLKKDLNPIKLNLNE